MTMTISQQAAIVLEAVSVVETLQRLFQFGIEGSGRRLHESGRGHKEFGLWQDFGFEH